MSSVFVNSFGRLSATGNATMTFQVPAIPVLAGLRLHFCGLTLDDFWPSSMNGISNRVGLTLVR